MKYAAPLLLSAWVVLSAQTVQAQDPDAHGYLRKGLALASAGDTVLAVAELRKALDADPDLAEAHYHIGRLYTNLASTVESDFRDRRRAEEALLEALRLDPEHPRYLFELGRLRLKQHMNVDGSRLMRRALSEAEELGDDRILADIHFQLGYYEEMQYEAVRHRRFRPFHRGPPPATLQENFRHKFDRTIDRYLESSPRVKGSGDEAAAKMLEHYREALAHDPVHLEAATRLLGYLYEEQRLAEYLAIARRLVKARPERARAHLSHGLGLHAAGREEQAGVAFDRALELLEGRERTAIENLAPVMRREAAEDYLSLDESERREFERRYWLLKDPLYLTDANERRLEHLARVAYADLRFSEPATGLRGWETDRGVILIRYGFPQEIASFRHEQGGDRFSVGRQSITWSYGDSGPIFMFNRTPGYRRARFAGDYEFVAEEYRHTAPATYENIPSIARRLDLPVQIARFRGETMDEIAVEIHAELPLKELADGLDVEKGELETGMFVVNESGQRVVEQRANQVLRYAESGAVDDLRSWRVMMPESDRLVAAVEARDAISWRAATARDTFTAVPFSGDTLGVSDMLVADVLRPLVEEPSDRLDYDIVPNPSLTFRSGEPVHIYWELYGLGRDAEDFAAYDVALALRVKELYREGTVSQFLGAIADAWGFSVVGDDRIELQFSRQVKMDGRDRVTEYLRLDPKKTPPGEYEIRLRVWDRLNERLVSRHRTFTVIGEE